MSRAETAPPRAVYAGIFVCSFGVLMQEILLTRIFSFTIWYHLAYLTISTALLGFGAAGSLLAAFPSLLGRGARSLAATSSCAAGAALFAALWWLGPRPLDPGELLSAPGQFSLKLLGYYAAVTVPFFFGGIAVAAPLAAYPARVARLYAADLFGAGMGCLGAVMALTWLDGAGALALCTAALVAAGACYAPNRVARAGLSACALAIGLAVPEANRVIELRPSVSKQFGADLATAGTKQLFTQWSPVNRVDLYQRRNSWASFWVGAGLSRSYRGPLPRSLDIQYDGHNGSAVYEVRGPDSLRMLDHHLLRVPYLLAERPSVLVIGVGGGVDVLNALHRGARRVTAVELQPITVELHRGRLSEWTGGAFERPEVELVAGEGRHFVASSPDHYDLIQITATDTFSAQSTGAYVLAESYLYTVEAMEDFLDHLEPEGAISLVLGDVRYDDPALPSPLATRLALVARAALERRGVNDPTAHLVLVSLDMGADSAMGGVTSNLLVKPSPFSPEQLRRIAEFSETNGFDVRLAPGVSADETMARIATAPAAELPEVLSEVAFTLDPVTDDRPFFYHVLPWSSVLSLDQRVLWAFPGSSIGQLMLVMMLAQALLLGGALILLPLLRGARGATDARTTAAYLIYFLSLGVGFLLIEISFVQKYVLLLGYPTYSLSVTIFSLLVFAALGAFLAPRGWRAPRRFLATLLAVTIALVAIEILALPWLRDSLLAAPLALRIAATAALQLPLGVCLGMYFPTGIELVRRHDERLVPWAWAVNGVGSVASTVLAVILGMAIGFSGVAFVAAGIYVVGTGALLAVLPPSSGGAPSTRATSTEGA